MGLSKSRVHLCSAVRIVGDCRVYTFMILKNIKKGPKVLGSLIYILVFLNATVSIIAEKNSLTNLLNYYCNIAFVIPV